MFFLNLHFNYNFIMKKKLIFRRRFFILFILCFIVFWCIEILYNIRYARIVDEVTISIDGIDDEDLELIKMYRIGLTSGLSEIDQVKDKDNKIKWKIYNYYIKKILISIPNNYIDNLTILKIYIGKKEFTFNNQDIKSWEIIKDKDINNSNPYNVTYLVPDKVRGKTSIIPYFIKIINWRGFLNIIFLSLLNNLIFIPIVIILFFFSINDIKITKC